MGRATLQGKKAKSFLEKRSNQQVKDWNKEKISFGGKLIKQGGPTNLLNDIDTRQAAYQRVEVVDTGELKQNKNKEAENTRRVYFKELRKVIEAADVIVQVLDARDPGSCRSASLEAEVLSGNKKKMVYLLNKIDLVPQEACNAWLHALRRDFPTIAFKASRNGTTNKQYVQSSVEAAYSSGVLDSNSAAVGAEELMQLLKNYTRTSAGSKSSITVGIVGYPNVGKSSVINSLKRKCVVQVGGTAGVTKTMQEVQLDSKVRLIDSPGVVFAGASDDPSVVLRSAVKVEHLSDPSEMVRTLLPRFPAADIETHFGVTLDQGVDSFLTQLARVRGKLKRGGGVCHDSAARIVLIDMMQGKFRYFVMPPTLTSTHESVKVVNALAPEFKITPDDDEGMDVSCKASVVPDQKTRREDLKYFCDNMTDD